MALNEEQKNQLKILVFDENNDGSLDNIIEYATNEFGQVSEVLLDFDNDGKADFKVYFEYDEKGRLHKKLKDVNLSGKINTVELYEYDENGNLTIKYDDNADGKYDFIETPDGEIKDIRDAKTLITDRIVGLFPKKIREKLLK